MNCEICNQPFNLTSKLPLMLHCCGGTTCKECIINLAGGPQQTLFTCPHKDCGEKNQDQNTLKANKHLVKVLNQSLGILCDQHPQNNGDFYCWEDQQFICAVCIVSKHANHKCIPVDKQEIITFNNKMLEFLKIQYKKIETLIENIQHYQLNEKQLSSFGYLELIKDAETVVNPSLIQQGINPIKFPPFKQQEREELKVQQQPIQQVDQIQQVIIDSKLINQSDYKLLKQFLNTENLTLELLYRGTEHGFKVSDFHEKCDNKGPTITVAKSEHNQIFGGYASISWESQDAEFKEDSEAFIFQLTQRFKLEQYQNSSFAVFHSKDFGPTFGNDLMLGLDIDFNKSQSCNAPIEQLLYRIYKFPLQIQNKCKEAEKYLGGDKTFQLLEIEVFRVTR